LTNFIIKITAVTYPSIWYSFVLHQEYSYPELGEISFTLRNNWVSTLVNRPISQGQSTCQP